MEPSQHVHRKILLDSNIWRYVADANLEKQIINRMKKTGNCVVIAPAVVYEALRIKDDSIRRRLTSLMAMRQWFRLMPEAYYESMEILTEARRVCPEVLYRLERPTLVGRLKQDWRKSKGGFWDRVRLTPDLEASNVGILEGDTLDLARNQATERRASFLEHGFHFEKFQIETTTVKPISSLPGWDGEESEIWRVESMMSFKHSILTTPGTGNAYWDWMSHALDLVQFVSASSKYVRFWIKQVEASRMPRHWIRSNADLLMGTRKVSPGTPADSQLATYMIDADLFISSDKVFVDVINKMRPHSPVPMAQALLVQPGADFADALLESLTR